MTNRQLVDQALKLLGVIDAEQSANIADATLGLEELNAMLTDMAADGIDLEFPPQDNLADPFPLEDQVANQLKPILAVYLHTSFPATQPSSQLLARATNSRKTLARDSVMRNMQEASLSNLPRGTGQSCVHSILTDT